MLSRPIKFILVGTLVAGLLGVGSFAIEFPSKLIPQSIIHYGDTDQLLESNKPGTQLALSARNGRAWYETFLERPTDWLLVLFNGLLALFTVRLFYVATASNSVALKAANAAELSAKAAIGIELPVIRALIAEIEHIDEPIVDGKPYATVNLDGAPYRYSALTDIEFRNFGRTLAFPTKLDLGWRATLELPDQPKFDGKTIIVTHASVIEPAASITIDIDATIELSEEEQAAIKNETAYLWLYGSLHYTDFLNQPHEARFCWRRCLRDQGGSHGFASDGGPPSAYIR